MTQTPPQSLGSAEKALDPAYLFPYYRSTVLRSPGKALVIPPAGLTELTGPRLGAGDVRETDADLTVHGSGEPIGERIIVHGRVTDSLGKPVRNTLVEVWQANSAGRYIHKLDQHPAPLDPNFVGAGRCLTDDDGRYNAVRDDRARKRMVSAYDHTATRPEWATGYRFDIVLGGAEATPFEEGAA